MDEKNARPVVGWTITPEREFDAPDWLCPFARGLPCAAVACALWVHDAFRDYGGACAVLAIAESLDSRPDGEGR